LMTMQCSFQKVLIYISGKNKPLYKIPCLYQQKKIFKMAVLMIDIGA